MRYTKLFTNCFLLSTAMFLFACAYERQAGRAEADVRGGLIGETAETDAYLDEVPLTLSRHALRLSDHYKVLGDQAAQNRDAFALGLIAIVGGTALANVSSVGGAELAAATAIGVGVSCQGTSTFTS